MHATLYYFHDPMCSWCYAFRPVWETILQSLPAEVTVKRLLGGLAPDTVEPMPAEMREYLQNTWRRIEARVPGTRFNFAFWDRCEPRRATYPACRAVIAAREQGDEHDERMTRAIQRAYYRDARNPADRSTLVELADELGLDVRRFDQVLSTPATHRALLEEIETARGMGVRSFPSLVLEAGGRWPIPVDYNDPEPVLEALGSHLGTGPNSCP